MQTSMFILLTRVREWPGARFKDQDVPPTKQYVFNGVKFDHASSRVCLGPKVVSKLKRDTFSRLTFLELEAAVGRLL